MTTTFSQPEQGYRHFDLPVDLLEDGGSWVPPKSNDPSEIEQLSVLPSGSLIARRQATGVEVASHMLDYLSHHDISNFGPRILSAAGFNTAWHNHAEGVDEVTRRRLWLPVHNETARPISRQGLTRETSQDLAEALPVAQNLAYSVEGRHASIWAYKKQLGRRIGNASLKLASVPFADLIDRYIDDTVYVQDLARRGAMQTRTDARDMRRDIGVYPSLAQLADRFGPLPVHIQRNGDRTLIEALDYAQTTALRPDPAS